MIYAAFSRHLIKHPWQLSLAILGVTVGISVIVAIRLAQHSAYASFAQTTQLNTAGATHQIRARSDNWISQPQFIEFKRQQNSLTLSPVVDFIAQPKRSESTNRTTSATASAETKESPADSIYIIGVEPVSRADILSKAIDDSSRSKRISSNSIDFEKLMSIPNYAATNLTTFTRLTVDPATKAARFSLNGTQTRDFELLLHDVLPSNGGPDDIANNVIIVDIASAQEILHVFDRIKYIDCHMTKTVAEQVKNHLPQDWEIIDLAVEQSHLKNMTSAFYTNLTALSLMALLVGMFLIYNTETFLVLQRRQMIARMRAIGVTSRQIVVATLFESLIIGAVGSLLGVIVGIALTSFLLARVSATLNDLYFQSAQSSVFLSPIELGFCFIIGIFSTVIAGLIPARSTTRLAPTTFLQQASFIERTDARFKSISIILSTIAFLLCIIVLSTTNEIVGGFIAMALALIGFAAFCPIAMGGTIRLLSYISTTRTHNMLIGARSITLNLPRVSTATAALMIATAAAIGIAIMVSSFRVSVSEWLDDVLRAESYVSKSFDAQTDGIGRENTRLTLDIKQAFESLSEVDFVSSVLRERVTSSQLTTRASGLRLSAFELNARAKNGFRFIATAEENVWRNWETENVIAITEPFAYRHKLSVGDNLSLDTEYGVINFKIVGVYKDYASEQGGIAISRSVFDQYWLRNGYDGLGIYIASDVSIENFERAVNSVVQLRPNIEVASTAALKEKSLEIFDRTFLITDVLRVIAIVVALIGITGALLAQQLERSREYATYRAIGFSRMQLFTVIATQTCIIGTVAALIALPAGLSVAIILIEVINPRSFGWTMSLSIPIGVVVQTLCLTFAAAAIAGLIPALKIMRISPATALRYE